MSPHHWQLTLSGDCLPMPDPARMGLMVGYSVFTTFRAPWRGEEALQAHWQRLSDHSRAIDLAFPWTGSMLAVALDGCLQDVPEAVIRLTVVPVIDHVSDLFVPESLGEPLASCLMVTIQPVRPGAAGSGGGLSLLPVSYERPMPHLKHGNYLEAFLHRRNARRQGYDDVVWINGRGHLSEASTANFVGLRGETLFILRPERDGALAGITRDQVCQAAVPLGLRLSEESLTPASVETLEGAFLTNAVQGLRRVDRVGGMVLPWPKDCQVVFEQLNRALCAPLA
jgi:branched-subunit amino acid aminotransferase/4-amino-4-deoxychorismate lyase